jgi:hypothetical protein
VDKNNGTISVANELDFESKASYSIELEAKDGGNKIKAVSVNIVITDDNDNPPIFDPPGTTSASLDENQENGFSVTVKVNLRVLKHTCWITWKNSLELNQL